MGRPRKWANDAERKAAKRINGRVNGQVGEAETMNEAETSREPSKRTRPESEIVEAEIPVEAETYEAETRVEAETSGFVHFRHQPHVPLALFAGQGRGTVRRHTDGLDYVMVSRHAGSDLGELGVVAADDWIARLSQSCIHGNRGWSCHTC